MNKQKWKILGNEQEVSDEELIALLKSGKLKVEDLIMSAGFKKWVKVADTIYQYYLSDQEGL